MRRQDSGLSNEELACVFSVLVGEHGPFLVTPSSGGTAMVFSEVEAKNLVDRARRCPATSAKVDVLLKDYEDLFAKLCKEAGFPESGFMGLAKGWSNWHDWVKEGSNTTT